MIGIGHKTGSCTPGPRRASAIIPLTEAAFLARFDEESLAARWAAELREQAWAGVVDVVAAYRDVAVFADPETVNLDALKRELAQLQAPERGDTLGRTHEIPVLYDGPDLVETAQLLGLEPREVVSLHGAAPYRVFALGFLPGFPYAGWLRAPLAGLPRREPPRTRVPAGSVAIAGRQTGIYPARSPGGWRILGRTPLVIADLATAYFPIAPGDQLRFVPIDVQEYEARRHERL